MADILIVDDEPDIRTLLGDILVDEGHGTRMADTADSALNEINLRRPDLIVLDIWLQGSRMDGIEVLKNVKRDNPDVPVLIISGHGNIEVAVAAIRQGAYDFIEKPFKLDHLLVSVARALEASRLRRENADLKAKETRDVELVGRSQAIGQLRQALVRAGPTGSRVLFSGAPGSGKEIAARYLHAMSKRADGPFVVVNSASIEPNEMERVLFGEERDGAPTAGLFEKAHGGTLFFDEVADMPLGTQSKILRVLVDQSFQPFGRGDDGARGSSHRERDDRGSDGGDRRRPLPRGPVPQAQRWSRWSIAAAKPSGARTFRPWSSISWPNSNQQMLGLPMRRQIGDDAIAAILQGL